MIELTIGHSPEEVEAWANLQTAEAIRAAAMAFEQAARCNFGLAVEFALKATRLARLAIENRSEAARLRAVATVTEIPCTSRN